MRSPVPPNQQVGGDFSQTELQIYPPDSAAFLTYGEMAAPAKQAELRVGEAEAKAAKLAARLRA